MELQEYSMAQARLGLALVSMDQVCRDNRWELAALMGQLPEPDSEAMARAADRGALVNHSRLAEPRWAAAAA
eukprot:3949921-Lingulodinium_polyedra.AAC.1